MNFLLQCDHEREFNLSDSYFSLVRFMRSLVSPVILFVLPSVTLFALSNLYVRTLLITVHYLWVRPKGERQVQKIVLLENCGLVSLPRNFHPCPPVLNY